MKQNYNLQALALIAVTMLLAFFTDAAAQQNINGKAAASTIKADPAAYELLKDAHDARCNVPQDFNGFTANISFNDNGRLSIGKLSYASETGAQVEMIGLTPESKQWLDEQVNSIIGHRRGGDFAKADGRHPITFGDNDTDNPRGRLVKLNDKLQSSYRVKNKRVTEVTRTMEGQRFTISILETTTVEGNKFLPRHFTVNYFYAATNTLKRSEAFSDAYSKIGGVWLPTMRRVVRAENGAVTTRIFEFQNVQLKN